ncbi:MAG: glycosyltransferase family 39 protein [Candidatus Riflebacteria bacterium]|nr:glycosyltransferase family 39 protein [Candidatus Riflebacteria bacterium]
MSVSVVQMQHDVWSTSVVDGKTVLSGHCGYIKYLQLEYRLPDCDVSKVWQYAHPPLHHIFSAIWLEINEKVFNIKDFIALESLQILTLFYVLCIIISSYKIFRFFKLDGIPFYSALTITSFCPSFIMLTGSINNDALSVAFTAGTMLNALYWKKEQNVRNMVNLALCFGLGIMSKISVGMLAPALFILFVSTFFKSQNKKDLGKQFAIFLLISVPLGTWFNIRNYINYKVPFTFVHHMDSIPNFKPQYVGNINYIDRITDFSSNQFDSVFVQNVQLGSSRNDYNPILTLLKCALFDEYINDVTFELFPIVDKVCVCFYITFIIITILSVFSMFYSTIQYLKQKIYIDEIIFMLVYFITLMLCIYKHSYDIPYVAAMNFRYITPTIIITQLFWGMFNQNSNLLQLRNRNTISGVLAIVFALCSTIVFSTFNMIL